MKYVPAFEAIKKESIDIIAAKGKLRVSACYQDLVKTIKLLISALEVNEDWYPEQSPKIAKAVQKGKVAPPAAISLMTAGLPAIPAPGR